MDKIDYRDQISIPAEKLSVDDLSEQGRLIIDFNVHGDPLFRWRTNPPAEPTVEDLLEQRPAGPYRWTAFHAHSYKRYFVLLVLIEPPYGSWWLGSADTLEQAENIFFTWLNTHPQPLLGPSSSIGAYGI